MNEFQEVIGEYPELAPPLSVVNAVKFAKQAYYNGNPNYYSLPTTQENSFIYPYLGKANGDSQLLSGYVDRTGQFGRITTFMQDIDTDRMETIEAELKKAITKIFPKDRYGVNITGKSLLFLKGTKYLINNLILSLSLAILLIAFFMAYLFRSFKMILISLIPNLLPLIITAGVMGFAGIPLKPSTILVFSIAFGISVDDTIHFLSKLRLQLAQGRTLPTAVKRSFLATGKAIVVTSLILCGGFMTLTTSSFLGTFHIGLLISLTLLFAVVADLTFLPWMVLRWFRPKV